MLIAVCCGGWFITVCFRLEQGGDGVVFYDWKGSHNCCCFFKKFKSFKKTFNSSLGPKKHHIINDIEVFLWTK